MPNQKSRSRTQIDSATSWPTAVDTVLPMPWESTRGSNAEPVPPSAISSREYLRKLWHIAPATTAFVLPFCPHYGNIAEHLGANTIRLLVVTIICGLAAIMLVSAKSLSRDGERDFSSAVGGYALLVMLPLLVFPHRLELGMTVLVVIAVGDGAAGLIGLRYGGERLTWNSAKTVTGTAAFVMFGIPAATGAYWLGSQPRVPFTHALLLGTMTSLSAAFAESVASEINDNIRVGVAAIGSVLLWHGLLSGWN